MLSLCGETFPTLFLKSDTLAQPVEALEKTQPTWADGSSSSLLSEDSSVLFSGGAGAGALLKAGWEVPSFGGDRT